MFIDCFHAEKQPSIDVAQDVTLATMSTTVVSKEFHQTARFLINWIPSLDKSWRIVLEGELLNFTPRDPSKYSER